jgi:hypothetical protein
MGLLHFKIHSTSGADKGQVFAATQYVTDALVIANRWHGRSCIIKHQGRVVWNHALDKDGWRGDNPGWFAEAQTIIEARIRDIHRGAYDKTHGTGAYDRMLAEADVWPDITQENQAAAQSVRP